MGQSVFAPNSSQTSAAPLQANSFRTSRPNIAGPDIPEERYPIRLEGIVQHGFGRGSKDLGCPTANLPDESITHIAGIAKPGVYYGYARVYPVSDPPSELLPEDLVVLPMAMSLGWNPFYKNQRMTAEIHIMHEFNSDFYGCELKVLILGYIRPEFDYISREALIDDIDTDRRVALNSLARPGYEKYASDPFFSA
ncbi:riboflavin kinase [Boletus coccyginus]|nr:riboflavin kinase [Boletus coccyginus]